MTSVGSNPIKIKIYFLSFLVLSGPCFGLSHIFYNVLNRFKPNREFFRDNNPKSSLCTVLRSIWRFLAWFLKNCKSKIRESLFTFLQINADLHSIWRIFFDKEIQNSRIHEHLKNSWKCVSIYQCPFNLTEFSSAKNCPILNFYQQFVNFNKSKVGLP